MALKGVHKEGRVWFLTVKNKGKGVSRGEAGKKTYTHQKRHMSLGAQGSHRKKFKRRKRVLDAWLKSEIEIPRENKKSDEASGRKRWH